MSFELTHLDAEQARAKASQCREDAKRVNNPQHKVVLVYLAQTWERLARSLEGDQEQTHVRHES